MGGNQNLERANIERPVFRKFETSNIEITKVELFDFLYFFILQYFEKLLLLEIEHFQKFDVFWNWKIWEIFNILENTNFSNFPHYKFSECSKLIFFYFQNYKFLEISRLNFFEFAKLQIFRIFQTWSFWNCPNWKIKKFQDFFNLENQSLARKIGNFGIVRPFDIPHYSQFCQFSYLFFDINQFRRFNL